MSVSVASGPSLVSTCAGMENHLGEALVVPRDTVGTSGPALGPLDSVYTSGPASGDSDTVPTSADLRSGRDTPFTEDNVQRFAEEHPGAPGDYYGDYYADAESESDDDGESALLSSGEPRDGDAPPDEANAPSSNAVDVPEQRPNTPL